MNPLLFCMHSNQGVSIKMGGILQTFTGVFTQAREWVGIHPKQAIRHNGWGLESDGPCKICGFRGRAEVILVVSTCGLGEIPANCKQTWMKLQSQALVRFAGESRGGVGRSFWEGQRKSGPPRQNWLEELEGAKTFFFFSLGAKTAFGSSFAPSILPELRPANHMGPRPASDRGLSLFPFRLVCQGSPECANGKGR